jgi:hypothetical protein
MYKMLFYIFGIPLLIIWGFLFITDDIAIKSCGGLKFVQTGNVIYLEDGTTIKGEQVDVIYFKNYSQWDGYKFDDERLPFEVTLYDWYKPDLGSRWSKCSYYELERRFLGIKLQSFDSDGLSYNPNG